MTYSQVALLSCPLMNLVVPGWPGTPVGQDAYETRQHTEAWRSHRKPLHNRYRVRLLHRNRCYKTAEGKLVLLSHLVPSASMRAASLSHSRFYYVIVTSTLLIVNIAISTNQFLLFVK